MRYLHALVKHRRIGPNLWLKPEQLPARVAKYSTVIYDLLRNGSQMTPEIVEAKLMESVGHENATLFLEAVQECNTTPAQVREIHDYLLDNYIKTSTRYKLESFLHNLNSPGALDNILDELRSLKAMQPSKSVNLGSQTAVAVKEAFEGDKMLIKYGFPTLDKRLGGCTRGEITLLAARPGHGKTSFAMQLMLNWSKMGYKVIMFSLEMPTSRLIQKMMSNQSKVPGHKIRTGRLDDAEKDRLTKTAEEFVMKFKDNLLIYDDVYSVREMESIISKHKPDIVLVDFIQLVEMGSAGMRTNEIAKVMMQFKRIAKEYNNNMFVISQLNRNVEGREDPVPRLSDLAESGSLEQLSADVAFIWYGHKVDAAEPANLIDIYFQKTRYGETSHFRFTFDGSTMSYMERAGARQEAGEDHE